MASRPDRLERVSMAKDLPRPLRVAQVASLDETVKLMLRPQIDALSARGFDVRNLCAPGVAHDWLVEHGYHMVDVIMPRRISPFRDLITLWKLTRYFRRERIAVVHTHNPKPGLLGQLAARLAGVPVIINTIHGFYFHEHMTGLKRWFYVTMERIAARCSSIILSQNPEDIETAVTLGIAPRERLRLLGNGINLDQFNPNRFDAASREAVRSELGIPEKAVALTIIARHVREKGIVELMQAMRELARRHENVHLIIIGPPEPDKKDHVDPAQFVESAWRDCIHILGRRSDVPEILFASDIFVLPSWREGFPRAAMEAACMGLPIVATDIRGCRQVVEHEKTGLLVPPRDPSAMESALASLIEDGERRKPMGAAGRQKALREFDERRVCRILLETYDEMLRRVPLTP